MQVKTVGIRPTKEQNISLTPELLASVGARYSRNNEGLEAILEKVEGMDQDKAVDSIFKMVDYGHRSISDMAPVAMFMDNISIYMALKIWHLCPTAGGQESSTRYVKLNIDKITLPPDTTQEQTEAIEQSFKAYETAYELWSQLADENLEILNIPEKLMFSSDAKTKQTVDRLIRNFAFDRARYFIPMCCQTNVMMVMQARGWVDLIQYLASDNIPESRELAEKLTIELNKVTPRLTKHATYNEQMALGIQQDFEEELKKEPTKYTRFNYEKSHPTLDVMIPKSIKKEHIVKALQNHNNRYAYFGKALKRITTRFGWRSLTIAELRDLNRHRVGYKHFTLIPNGFYCSDDEIEKYQNLNKEIISKIKELRIIGEKLTLLANEMVINANPSFVYFLPMGTQCSYQHTTGANFLLYQIELRTGLGAHFTYAARMREILELWHKEFPETLELIKAGLAEPE